MVSKKQNFVKPKTKLAGYNSPLKKSGSRNKQYDEAIAYSRSNRSDKANDLELTQKSNLSRVLEENKRERSPLREDPTSQLKLKISELENRVKDLQG